MKCSHSTADIPSSSTATGEREPERNRGEVSETGGRETEEQAVLAGSHQGTLQVYDEPLRQV